MIKLPIGGSPCTHWSIVRQKKKGLQKKDVEYNIGYADGVVAENERIRSLL